MEETNCERCGRRIYYVKLRSSTRDWTPLDMEPVWIRRRPIGGTTYINDEGLVIFGEPAEDGEDLIKAYVPHYSTCPNPGSGRFTRPKSRKG